MKEIFELLVIVLGQVISLFLLIGVGFFLGKLKKLSKITISENNYVLLYVISPCVILNSFIQCRENTSLLPMIIALVLGLIIHIFTIIFYRALTKLTGKEVIPIFEMGAAYGNVGFFGIPVCQMLLGIQSIPYLSAFMTAQSILIWTHGVKILNGKVSVKRIFINPAVPAFIVGMMFLVFKLSFPPVVDTAFISICNLYTPLAMMLIGAQMASSDLLHAFKNSNVYSIALQRLVFVPVILWFVLKPLGLDTIMYRTIVVSSAVPVAGYVGMFAQLYGGDEDSSSQLILLTTILAGITVPFIATLSGL